MKAGVIRTKCLWYDILTESSAIRWPNIRYSDLVSDSEPAVVSSSFLRPTKLSPPPSMGTHPPVESSLVMTWARTCTRYKSSLKTDSSQIHQLYCQNVMLEKWQTEVTISQEIDKWTWAVSITDNAKIMCINLSYRNIQGTNPTNWKAIRIHFMNNDILSLLFHYITANFFFLLSLNKTWG